jgi:nucleoside-diphosphate-sugar epimerase
MTYGPGQRPHKLIPYIVLDLLRGCSPRLSSGRRKVDWVYVDDVIDGFLAAARRENIEGDTIDLGSGVLVSIREIVMQLTTLVNVGIEPRFGALPDRPFEKIRVADVESAYVKLRWRAETTLESGLAQTVEWYRVYGNAFSGKK